MIPIIEDIIAGLASGQYTIEQARGWIARHLEMAEARGARATPARERPGAQAPSTAALPTWDESRRVCNLPDVDTAIRNLLDDPTEDNATCLVRAVLAAPSTGGAETAALYGFDRENLEAVAEGLAIGYEASISIGNVTGEGEVHLESTTAYAARFIRTVLASSAPASSTGGAETAEPCQQGCFEKIEGRTACVGRCKQAARAAASAPAQAVETAGVREQDFEKGWRTAANWMERDDLIADIGGAAYLKDRAAALQSPAASPASKEDGAQLGTGSGAGAQSDSGADSGHFARAVQSEGSTGEAPALTEDQFRELFEDWCVGDDPRNRYAIERAGTGGYRLMQTQSDWTAWLAARAALAKVEAKEKTR